MQDTVFLTPTSPAVGCRLLVQGLLIGSHQCALSAVRTALRTAERIAELGAGGAVTAFSSGAPPCLVTAVQQYSKSARTLEPSASPSHRQQG